MKKKSNVGDKKLSDLTMNDLGKLILQIMLWAVIFYILLTFFVWVVT